MGDEQVYLDKQDTRQSYPTRRGYPSKRSINRYAAEGNTEGVSASAKKLKMPASNIDVNYEFGYRMINFATVFAAIAQYVKCKVCNSNISFQERHHRGLGFKIIIVCPNCREAHIPSTTFIRNSYEINRRMVLAMRLLGIGLDGIAKFCAFMELPRPVLQSFYDEIVVTISTATKCLREMSMRKAAREEKKKSEENGKSEGITVSGDGSWWKPGFASLFGITSLIGWFTGKIVDVEVEARHCKSCEEWKSKSETPEFEEWRSGHVDKCEANHDASSGKMEVNAAIEMFSRSEKLHGLKYENYIGNSDSKIFKGIKESKPYENFEVKMTELDSCLDGYTQNSNEAFNATVWELAPKSYSSGKRVLDIATDLALCNHNDGLTSILQVMRYMEMDVGSESYNFCCEADTKRMQLAKQSLKRVPEEASPDNKPLKKGDDTECSNIEGQLDGPGIGDQWVKSA